jgi:hypothetical protein
LDKWSKTLNPYWYYNQRTDWTADSRPDENRFNNCLSESMAMTVKYITDLELPSDYIHDTMYPEGFIGYMDFGHAATWFRKYLGVIPSLHTVSSQKDLTWWVHHCVTKEIPTIGLYYFNKPMDVDAKGNALSGHFRTWVGCGGNGNTTLHVVTGDPWTGLPRTETVEDHWNWSQNSFLVIPRKRSVVF